MSKFRWTGSFRSLEISKGDGATGHEVLVLKVLYPRLRDFLANKIREMRSGSVANLDLVELDEEVNYIN